MRVSDAEAISPSGGLIPGPGPYMSDVLAAAPPRAHCDAYTHGIVEEKACRVSAWPVHVGLHSLWGAQQNTKTVLRYPKQCK
jgi:hypothetical protein